MNTPDTQQTRSTFRDLGILPETAEALDAVGILHPFPIQEMTLPVALSGSDVIGQAKTGTGKTLGFGLPLLERVVVPADVEAGRVKPEQLTDAPQALVVVPTRELCQQVTNDLLTAGKVRNVRVQAIYGGRAYEPQVEALRAGCDVVVGTPGRLLDLAGQKKLSLAHVKALVLDEADEMLDLGFLPDVERIITMLPAKRQTMLFSATMPGAVISLARRYMSRPTHIRATSPDDEGQTHANIAQHVFRAHSMDKPEMVSRILQAEGRDRAMIFCRTKRTAADISDQLTRRGFAAGAVHGDLGQGAREQALRAFRNGKVDVLVCTDVAARGIDVDNVTHVVNYQTPEDEKTYLHRIGRTGRAGKSGTAVTLVDWDDIPRWKLINKALELPFDDPEETYSTSAHLYEALGIPAGTKGILPRSERTRAGLAAEEIEDLGETGGRGAGRGRGPKDAKAGREAVEERPERTRTPRQRRRTRNGTPLDASVPAAAQAADVADVTAVTEAVETVTAGPAVAAVAAGTTAPETPARPRRRRRTRGTGTSAAPAATAAPVASAPEAPAAPAAEAAPAVMAPVIKTAAVKDTAGKDTAVKAPATAPAPEAPARPRRRARTAAVRQETVPTQAPSGRTRPRYAAPAPAAAEAEFETVETALLRVQAAAEAAAKAAAEARTTAASPEATAEVTAPAAAERPKRSRATAGATRRTAEATEAPAAEVTAEPAKRTRRVARRAETTTVTEQPTEAVTAPEPTAEPVKRTRRVAKRAVTTLGAETTPVTEPTAEAVPAAEPAAEPAKRTRRVAKRAVTTLGTETEPATEPAAPADEPVKPKRTRTTKKAAAAPVATDGEPEPEAKPKRTRTAKKAVAEGEAEVKPKRTRTAKKAAAPVAEAPAADEAGETAEAAAPVKRTRKRAVKATAAAAEAERTAPTEEPVKPKRTRTTKKAAAAPVAKAEVVA